MNNNTSIIKHSIIGASIALSALLLGQAIKNRNVSQDSISVTGLGSKNFVSDEIQFNGSYSCKAMDAKEAYSKIQADHDKVLSFFKAKGFTTDQIVFSGITLNKEYKTMRYEKEDGSTRSEEIFDGYSSQQSVTLSAQQNPSLMGKIEKVSNETSELINDGIELNINPLQYTYSQLPALKHSLIESASKDASDRAQKITKSGGGNIGKLKNASMGVFQITGTGDNSEDSYGGNNDTYSKNKTARITVRLEYNLK
jgi:uncharacterized protein